MGWIYADSTWEEAWHLENAQELVDNFEKRNQDYAALVLQLLIDK